jgi:phage protein D/phage baseplate assembly protein gpV
VPGEEYSNELLVTVNGRPMADDVAALLMSAYVDESVNVPDLFSLRFSDENSTVLAKGGFSIGAEVRLLVQSSGPGGPTPLLSGEVTALETEVGVEGVHTVVRGFDKSHRLFRGRRVEAYLQCTASDIARKVAQRAGLRAGTINHSGPVLAHVAQDGVSDWDFLNRLAAESGAQLDVTDGALDFRAPTASTGAPSGTQSARTTALVLEQGVNLIALRATITAAEQVPSVQVRGWDPVTKKALVAVAPARTTNADLGAITPAAIASTFGAPSYVAPFAHYTKQAQCDETARALAGQFAGGFAEIEGIARGNPKLRAGVAVALADVGAPFAGKYTLSSTRHSFDGEAGYRTAFTVSNRSDRSFYGVTAGTRGSPPISGVVNAIVADVKDPEGKGRVKVIFPTMSDDYVSEWARTVQPGAGSGRGMIVLPEVGDEVLVAFAQGSFQQAYVLGGLYNGKDAPKMPWSEHVGANDGSIKRRAFVSRTGMTVQMLESPQGEQIDISTNNGSQRISLVQKTASAIEIVSEGPVTVTAKQDVSIKATGNIVMEGTTISIKARGNLELAGAQFKAAGTAAAEVSGATLKLAGNATAELSAGAMTTVRGAMVRIN